MTDIDFQQWDGELSGPPLQDCLRLCDFLPQYVQERFVQLFNHHAPRILSYEWHSQKNYEKAGRWTKGAVVAGHAGPEGKFFLHALLDTLDHDRALRTATAFEVQAIRREDIPERILRQVPELLVPNRQTRTLDLRTREQRYVLVEKKFKWDRNTPAEAVDAVARLMECEPPDNLWIAEYIHEREEVKWDPIIYAGYGDWQVEIARWE